MGARAGNPDRMENILEAHHSSALLVADSSNPSRNYQVFLSFIGTDVPKNFLSHLYAALDEKGIQTFVDREEPRVGEQISVALMKAIEESRVAIIIFSENYASSPWCLEEAVKIMECREQKGLIVFPVFYQVEPREVRGGRESYGRAMAKHECNFGKDSEKVRRWKKALFDANSLFGWDSNDSDEAELFQCIVKELSLHLDQTPFDQTPLDVTRYPVGIYSPVQNLIYLSKKKPGYDDVLMIGLWGPGGIGKTTVAKTLYNAIKRQFQGSSFLAQVRETSNRSNGLVALQEKLLSQILSPETVMVYSVDGGISLIRERLSCKKVLLILDDVDRMDQLDALAGKGDWFGKGSRIFVTTRDRHMLFCHGVNCVYEVQALRDEEALELFGRHAFPNGKRVDIRRDLIDRVVHYARGLPLALEVLGSFFCGRKESAWVSALDKLSKSLDKTIFNVLMTSFDGLEYNEREIFLDIACFFRGKPLEYIVEVLDCCHFNTTIGVEILIQRSLIKNENGTLQMHDLVQLMGMDIVNQECRDDPGGRSRIWLFEDAMDVLCGNTEKNAVKAIVLNGPAPEEITISPDAFTNMKMLRMLILHEVHISPQGPICLPNELTWLDWPIALDLEIGSGPKKLMSLDIPNSPMEQLGSKYQKFPDLSHLPSECLEVDLSSWRNVAYVSSLEKVPKTRVVDVILIGREMSQWIFHCKEGFISFMVPRDLYDKFLGLALCFAFGSKKGMRGGSYLLQISVNGGRVFHGSTGLYKLETDRVWLYVPRSGLNGVEELLLNDWSHFQVHFRAAEVSIKKCGFRLVYEQQVDDPRVCTPAPSADANKLGMQRKKLKRKTIFW